MSEPTRYDYEQAELNKSAGFYVRKAGHWVNWDDYAKLKAENERLRKMLFNFVDAYEDGQLDALLFVIRQAAKEGKQP